MLTAMRLHHSPSPARQRGTTLVEVLVTVVVLAFGLLGIAAFQAKAQVGTLESYQRAQAVVLLQDLRARIAGNAAAAADYVTETPLGTEDEQPDDCATLTAVSARDKCEWSHELKGASELDGTSKVGAMIGARGCVEELQAKDESTGVCKPGLYQITVAWQGMHPTKAPALSCGKDQYGPDTNRRAIAVRVAIGVPHCT
jgi:type IV pilus assembly protein PilV